MSTKNIIRGALILTLANLITRFLGFFYRIYMSNTIGAEGMGLYQLVMPIYMLCWSLGPSGFTTTISKLTAQENAKREYGNTRRVVRQSVIICVAISLVISFLLYLASDFVAASIIKDSRVYISLKILAFAFPFMSAGSCIRGYFFGIQDAKIPAVSQVLEQSVRILTVISLQSIFVPMGLEYACAAAVIGIVMGELLSFLFVFLSYTFFDKKKNPKKKASMSARKTFLTVTTMALPLTASKVTASLLSTIENILIPQRLLLYGVSASQAMSLYGSLTGMAMPLIQFPSALLMAVSTTLVPEISEATAIRNYHKINVTANRSFLFTAMIGIGTAGIFAIFPKEISMFVYNVEDVGQTLWKLAFLCPFLYLQITLSGILNGLAEHVFIFKNNIISSVINILFIYFLVPFFGTDAFILGWLFSLLVTSTLSVIRVIHITKIKPDFLKIIGKPVLAILASGLSVRYMMQLLAPSKLTVLLCIGLMVVLYILLLLFLGCIRKDNIRQITRSM